MRRQPLPDVLRLGPFSVRDADTAGVPRSRLRAADLVIPFRGTRAASGGSSSVVARCAACASILTEHQFFSHATAAQLWGFRMPRTGGRIHISAIVPIHAPRMRGVVGHHLQEAHVEITALDGLTLTTPAETWRHLSASSSLDALIIAGDGLVSRQHPLASRSQLARAVARHRGMRGARQLRAALDEIRPGTDSARETVLRLLLMRSGLPEPEVNRLIMLDGGRSTHGDLVYPAERVLVEYDGRQHATDPRQFAKDVLRHESLAAGGWTVIRVLAAHLDADPAFIVDRVRRALAGPRPPHRDREMPPEDSGRPVH